MKIRPLDNNDAEKMADIYSHYIKTSIYTFDEGSVNADYMLSKMEHLKNEFPLIGIETEEGLAGYAYGSLFRDKPAYSKTVESTIYIDPAFRGQGFGIILYQELLNLLKKQGFRMVIAVLGLPNETSEKLHKKLGFQHAGNLSNVGRKFDQWLDTGYWQLDLEKWPTQE